MANNELLDQVLNHIKTNPSTWDQGDWRCGAKYCFAGHAAILGGWKPVSEEDQIAYWKLVGYESLEKAIKDEKLRFEGRKLDPLEQRYREHRMNQIASIVPNTSDVVTMTGVERKSISLVAQELLEINEYTADELFSGSNDLHDLEELVDRIKEDGTLGHYPSECDQSDLDDCDHRRWF